MVDGTGRMDGVGEGQGRDAVARTGWMDGWAGPLGGPVPSRLTVVLPAPRFRLVPFLLELRVVIDWVWTDNALNLSNWICLEDVYANIFIMKCYQESEKVGTRQLLPLRRLGGGGFPGLNPVPPEQ